MNALLVLAGESNSAALSDLAGEGLAAFHEVEADRSGRGDNQHQRHRLAERAAEAGMPLLM